VFGAYAFSRASGEVIRVRVGPCRVRVSVRDSTTVGMPRAGLTIVPIVPWHGAPLR